MVVAQETQEQTPADLFASKCSSCHGNEGQGVEQRYDHPFGQSRLSAEQLGQLIGDTMPEDDPESCVGEEAKALAEYLFEEFYAAGQANPRVARLTSLQHRNALADLLAQFSPRGEQDADPRTAMLPPVVPGLWAEYYQSRGMNKADTLVHVRSESSIDFDFGESSPVDGISADQFSIIWRGALKVSDTGYHEFRITTENGARLYLNFANDSVLRRLRDDSSDQGQQALIDAWVGSGKARTRTARVFLLGGRTYPIRVEFFKYLEDASSITVEWQPPHGAYRTLDFNDTDTSRPESVYICPTTFPAEDRSLGFERGVSVSPRWHSAVLESAIDAGEEMVERLPLLISDEAPAVRVAETEALLLRFVQAAYRRPLTEREAAAIRQRLKQTTDPEQAVRETVVSSLMSPHFLYISLATAETVRDPHTVASQLSFGMWDSIPDNELLAAAASGQLVTEAEIQAQARRMMKDGRTRHKIHTFFEHWLELDERDLKKDEELFPEFDAAVIADLRRSLHLFIDDVVQSRESDYRRLLDANYLLLNDRLRKLYGGTSSGAERDSDGREIKRAAGAIRVGSEFQPVALPEEGRSGVLTHPYLLSALAYHDQTSPIHRGVFLTRNIVGRALRPPPVAVAFEDTEFEDHLTMREKVTQLTQDEACMACHSVINPLGFALESFDAVGRWRTKDNERTIDSRAEYITAEGSKLTVSNARDIADYAIDSSEARRAFVTQMFQHVVKQSPLDYSPQLIDELTSEFAEERFNIQRLWARIATVAIVDRWEVGKQELVGD